MKKNFLYSVMALFMVLLASCSQEEIISENNGNGKVTISVGVPGGAATRAGMPAVEGVIRRCIMQVVDENGIAIEGEKMKQTEEVTGETVTFTFNEPTGNYSVVFWADYVTNKTKDYVYNTTQLPIIGYQGNKDNMFTNAGDAFCGKIAKGTTSTTLKRPFDKIVIGSTNKELFGKYTKITIGNFNVPTGYNIMDGTCGNIADTPTAQIRLDERAINNAETGEWAYFYIFPSKNQTSTDLALNVTLSTDDETPEKQTLAVTIKDMPTDANMIGNVDITEIPAKEIEVTVSFDDKFQDKGDSTEPEEPATPEEIKVGSYIDANGKVTATENEAVAIVFDLATDDNISNYGEAFAGKKIKGWAIAMGKASQVQWMTGADALAEITDITPITNTDKATDINGYGNTQSIKNNGTTCIPGATFPALEACINWSVQAPQNTSGWYMPAAVQVQRLHTAWSENTFSAKLTNDNVINGVILSSSMYKNSSDVLNPLGVLFNSADATGKNGKINAQSFSNNYGARPILTIFE